MAVRNRSRSSSDPFIDPISTSLTPSRRSSNRPPPPAPPPHTTKSSKMPASQRDITDTVRDPAAAAFDYNPRAKMARSQTAMYVSNIHHPHLILIFPQRPLFQRQHPSPYLCWPHS